MLAIWAQLAFYASNMDTGGYDACNLTQHDFDYHSSNMIIAGLSWNKMDTSGL